MMLRKKTFFLSLPLAVMLIAACSSDDEAGDGRDYVTMPVSLSIPATDGPVKTRVGDPGTYEQFKLPRYAYIYIVCRDREGNDIVVHTMSTLDADRWEKTRYQGALANSGDSIFNYTGGLKVYLPINRSATGEVYAAVSTVPLKGLPTSAADAGAASENAETVQNYRYTLDSDTKAELANIYSTPYNYRPDGTTYYGTLTDLNSQNPHLDIVLYHVAAKLDLLWNVDPSLQPATAIKTLSLSLPDAASSYIFKPLQTEPTGTYSEVITTDVGSQWYGRASRYVVPMTGSSSTYSFQAAINTTSGVSRPTATIDAGTINKNQPFTTWMRGTITVKN